MTKKENDHLTQSQFADELMRFKRGSVTRRHFLGVTGLGLATAVLGRNIGPFSGEAYAQDLGSAMSIATWPKNCRPSLGGRFGVLGAFT